MATIVLVHGILGVGSELFPTHALPIRPVVDYFNGVKVHLEKSGIGVMAPTTPPLQAIEDRGKLLAQSLDSLPAGRVDIIAHSMGGLDARFVLHRYPDIAQRITSLTTIGTPHRGSAVADMVRSGTNALYDLAPAFLTRQIGALTDLTTARAQAFNEKTPDAGGVHYMNIAGVAPMNSQQLLLQLAAEIGKLSGANDGVVLRSSALYDKHEHLDDWPVDHFGEIGWASWRGGLSVQASDFYPDQHLERYNTLLAKIWSLPAR
ncbi:esterase/lipase family protein [Duganella guangzhouensis]|nr:alpha/beta fold hydrolase [Duganella guangzhouensis]